MRRLKYGRLWKASRLRKGKQILSNWEGAVMDQQSDFLKATKEFTAAAAKAAHESEVIACLLETIDRHLDVSGILGGLCRDDGHIIYGLLWRGKGLEDGTPGSDPECFIGPHAHTLREVIGKGDCLILNPDDEIWSSSDRLLLRRFSRLLGSFVIICPLTILHRTVGVVALESTAASWVNEKAVFIHAMALQAGLLIDRLRLLTKSAAGASHPPDGLTERLRELQQANENLQELNRLKSKFVAMVSHELRAPLAAIHMLADNLLGGIAGHLEEKPRQYLTRISSNIGRLQRLIADLLDLARIELGRLTLHLTRIELPQLVGDVVADLAPLAEARRVSMRLMPVFALPAVCGDRERLFQILHNLIHNAIKFSCVDGQVTISLQAHDRQAVEVCIADAGCGMPSQELKKFFNRFIASPQHRR
jgi:signal transduction histidine kinase